MHWLAERVGELSALSSTYEERCEQRRRGQEVPDGAERDARRALMALVDEVVGQLAERTGVLASFAAHDGLLVTGAGDHTLLEGAAAMSQWLLMPAENASDTLALGNVDQLLVSGSERKLAVLRVGVVAFGVVAPRSVNLASVLAE